MRAFFDGPDSEMKMQLTAIGARILLAGVLAGVIPAALAMGQATTSSPKSWAASHSVVVIGPNSPMFDTLLERWFPGVTGVSYFQQLKPLLAIIHNNTRRVIEAYVVKWTVTNADGSTDTLFLPVIHGPFSSGRLTGEATVLGPAGTGRGTELVTPFFHWSKLLFAGLLPGNGVVGTFSALMKQKPEVTKAQSAVNVQTTLDGVIFGDGVFVGPDTSKLYERFQSGQEAEVDECTWMLNLLSSGPTDQQIRDQLSQQIYQGRNSTGTDSASLYTAARGRTAETLLSVLDRDGQTGLKAVATRLAKAERLALHR